MPPIQRM